MVSLQTPQCENVDLLEKQKAFRAASAEKKGFESKKGEIDGEQVSERQGSRAAVGDLPGEEPRVTLTLTRGTATAAGTVKGQKTALGRTGRHGSCRRDPGWLRTDGSNRNRGRGEAAFLQTGPTCLHFALTSGCYNYLTPAVDYAAVDSLIRSGQRPGSMWPDYRSESHLNAHLYSLMCCAGQCVPVACVCLQSGSVCLSRYRANTLGVCCCGSTA